MKQELLYAELTEQIIGCLFRVFKSLGYGYQEKYYQRGLAVELERIGKPFKKELKGTINYQDRIIGRYFIDFLVEDRVAVELKVADDFYQTHANQLLAYLKSFDIKVGLLAVVTQKGIKVRRFVN